jgi:hydrogenase maturation protease
MRRGLKCVDLPFVDNMAASSIKKPLIVLLGVGNVLQTDDGVGVHVVNQMAQLNLPDQVELVDGGTAGYDILSLIENRKLLIVIDAVDGGMEPGTLFRFTPDDVEHYQDRMNSLHQFGLMEAIRMARLTESAPEKTVIIGIQPSVVDWGMTLSDPVRQSVPKVIWTVLEEINAFLRELRLSTTRNYGAPSDSLI